MVTSITSSISEKSMALLPDGEHLQPAGTLPSSIQIVHNAEDDEATLIVSPTVSLAKAHEKPTSKEKNQAHLFAINVMIHIRAITVLSKSCSFSIFDDNKRSVAMSSATNANFSL